MNESNSEKRDTFGNKIDLRVHYARGQILVDSHHEALRAGHARELLRERMQEQGTDSIYDFTGSPCEFPIQKDDLNLPISEVPGGAYFESELISSALQHLGGRDDDKAAVFNRTSAGITATILALSERGKTLVSITSGSPSHPSIKRAAALAGNNFVEVYCTTDLAAAIADTNCNLVVITGVTSELTLMENQEFIEVEGSAVYKDQKIPIILRLKGDRITHFEEKDKSSYAIKALGVEKIKGIRKFFFIKPRARNYIHEWLLHELAGEFGLSKLKYEFTNLKINGDSQGLYVFEEGFDKDLLERNQRRNGPIFSINEEYSTDIFKTKLELYNKNFWNRNENIKLSNYARNKLEGFLKKKFDLKDTFDLEKWASLFAVADLTYTHHGLDPQNVNFITIPLADSLSQ